MIFYKRTLNFIYLILITTVSLHKELRVTRSGSSPASVCGVALQFHAVLNNTSSEDYHVELIPDDCCLKSYDGEDCDSLQIIGECSEIVPKETTKTLNLVAPLIDTFERKGYCTIHIDSRPADRKRSIVRDTINIHFDTRIKNNNTEDLVNCKNVDEDPLNDCKPVNCETYYNGKRSYYDKHTKRCIEIPQCVNKINESIQIYDVNNNKCVEEKIISEDDMESIKSLPLKERHPKDVLIIKTMSTPRKQNSTLIDFEEVNQVSEHGKKSKVCQTAMQYFFTNKYTLIVLALVVTVQCCLIITMVYCLANNSECCNKKKVVRRFFNYRQDASVTTPLIGTSNMNTETTEFDFISDSSNIDKKIKCYKACQKEGQQSMSDDILLKCLNRRDWNSKQKSEMIREVTNIESLNAAEVINKVKTEDMEKSDETSKDLEYDTLSEKEIKCHSYFAHSKGEFKAFDNINPKIKDHSINTEKEAQACFSNDTMDDFLSERGMIYPGENASKYSFTSSSSPSPGKSTETSKTSKNNIIKNVLSMLSKSKMGTASDPGVKKAKSKNLELLHMSHASVYSSSSELKNVRGIQLVKESRSTF